VRVELRPEGVLAAGTESFSDGSGATLHIPAGCEWLGLAPGVSVDAAERRCIERRVPTIRIAPDRASICADYMGMRHLYVRERIGPEPVVTITDDPFEFAGELPPDLDVLRVLPALKFAPFPLSCVRGAERIGPGVRRVYGLRPLRLIEDRCFLPEVLDLDSNAGAVDLPHVLADIVADYAPTGREAHVFLSGGMDSALLTYLLRQRGLKVQAWTARFASSLGELEAARAVASARFLGAAIEVVDVDREGPQALTAILDSMREPFADVATVAESVLARAAAAGGAHNVFEGEGVDSLMCGSYKFVVERYLPVLRWMTAVVPDAALRGANRRGSIGRARLKIAQMKALVRAPGDPFERHLGFLVAGPAWRAASGEVRQRIGDAFRRWYDLFPRLDPMNRLAAMTFWGNIPNLENRKLDLVERYSGIRFSLLFQDPRFIRAALSTASERKVRFGYGKWVMRSAYRGALPPHTLTRKKISFVPPVLDLLGPEHEDVLRDDALFAREVTERMHQEHRTGTADHLPTLWAMFVASHWLRRYRRAEAAARANTTADRPIR
jgi:asparagine synthase (glutamine-hydrolysing)